MGGLAGFFGKVRAQLFDPFLGADPDPFAPNAKLQTALNNHNPQTSDHLSHDLLIPITIADITGTSPFPVAHFQADAGVDTEDFIASEAKVAAMYAAFRLRHTVNRFAQIAGSFLAVPKGKTVSETFFAELRKTVDPLIRAGEPLLRDGEDAKGNKVAIKNEHRDPRYQQMFAISGALPALTVDFTDAYKKSLREMIVNSSDFHAGICIHGIGYSFLNGVLEKAGYFKDDPDVAKKKGLWLAADYLMEAQPKEGKYPTIRGVISRNDNESAQAGTTPQMARLVANIHKGVFKHEVDTKDEMGVLLHDAISGLSPYTSDLTLTAGGGIPVGNFVKNKYGFEVLGRPKDQPQPNVYSEVSVLQNLTPKDKTYVVAWQNLQSTKDHKGWADNRYHYGTIAKIITDVINEYET